MYGERAAERDFVLRTARSRTTRLQGICPFSKGPYRLGSVPTRLG